MQFIRKLFTITFLFFTTYCFGQQIDSLKNSLITAKEDTNKVNILNALSWAIMNKSEYTQARLYADQALALSQKVNYKKGTAKAYNSIGNIDSYQGNYPHALENYFAAQKIFEETGNKSGVASTYGNIGNIYMYQANYPDALKNYFASLKICIEIGNKQRVSDLYCSIGIVYGSQGNYSEALKNFFTSLEIAGENGDKRSIGNTYNDIGEMYMRQNNYSEALKYLSISLKIFEEIVYKRGVASTLINLVELSIKTNRLTDADNYLNKALSISKEIGSKEHIKLSYQNFADLDSAHNNYKQAFEHYKMYIIYRDSLLNEENTKKTVQTQMNYEFEKKQAIENAEQVKKDALQAEAMRRQHIIVYTVCVILLLIGTFSVFIFRSYKQKNKANIALQAAYKTIEEKNKEVFDSIHYAKRIQQALLKEEEHISEHLPPHFILFKPKDIVSGDFYWAFEKQDHLYMAAADCTGHGVPGAFMSMLGIAFLNEINATEKLLSPNEILDRLREKIMKELNQSGADGESKDGMDISLARINLQTKELEWAGANNSMYHITNGELKEIKADKQPIGYYAVSKPFTNHSLILQTGESIYLFSDGYADQFSPQNKKLMKKKFKEVLQSIAEKTMEEQKLFLNTYIENWKGNLEQTDDILIIGIRA